MPGNLDVLFGRPFSIDDAPAVKPVLSQLQDAMIDAGIYPPDELFFDGKIHRFSIGASSDAGWYVAYDDEVPAGAFGNWKEGGSHSWCAKINRTLTMIEMAGVKKRQAEAIKLRDEERAKTAETVAVTVKTIWDNAIAASPDHPYLVSKGIQPHGTKVTGDGRLIVPMYGPNATLVSVEYIGEEKRYHSGGAIKGAFHILHHEENPKRIYFAEGFATAASIVEATHTMTVVCFSAGGLEPVTKIFREKYPTTTFVIVADNDASKAGEEAARKAATVSGAQVVLIPELGMDANDYASAGHDLAGLLSESSDIFKTMKVVNGADLPREYRAPDEIIEDVLVSASLGVVFGDSNTGKTFFAIAMAGAVATGRDFLGKKVEQGNVLYLAAEAPKTVEDRMQVLRDYYEADLSSFFMTPVPLNFFANETDHINVLDLVREIEKRHGKVKLIVADTLARLSSGANENSGQDMGPVMDRLELLAHETGAAVFVIHHTGKDATRGARGWSGVRGHISTEIELSEKTKEVKCATVTKQRELPSKGTQIFFKLEFIEVGTTKFGKPAQNGVAVIAQRPEGADPSEVEITSGKESFRLVWEKTGRETDENGAPYVSYSAWKHALQQYDDMTEASAGKALEPKSIRGPVFMKRMITEKLLIKHNNGYVANGQLAIELSHRQDRQ